MSHGIRLLDQKKESSFHLEAPPCSLRTQKILLLRSWNWTKGGRLCSNKPTTPGFGLSGAARHVKWSPMLWGIGEQRRVNGCGRPSQATIVLVTVSRISGQRIRWSFDAEAANSSGATDGRNRPRGALEEHPTAVSGSFCALDVVVFPRPW